MLKGKKLEYTMTNGDIIQFLLLDVNEEDDFICGTNSFCFLATKSFFLDFNKYERDAIIYHEFYHNKTCIKMLIFQIIHNFFPKLFIYNIWKDEFEADKYSYDNNGSYMIDVLNKLKLKGKQFDYSHPHNYTRIEKLLLSMKSQKNN